MSNEVSRYRDYKRPTPKPPLDPAPGEPFTDFVPNPTELVNFEERLDVQDYEEALERIAELERELSIQEGFEASAQEAEQEKDDILDGLLSAVRTEGALGLLEHVLGLLREERPSAFKEGWLLYLSAVKR